jgi:lysozyme
VPRQPGSLPPILDLEWNPHSPSCTTRPEAATVRSEAARFLSILSAHYGRRPIIYTTPDFYRTNDIARLGGELWLRAVTEHPTAAYPGQDWTFWQYSGTGRADGVRGRIDLNAFNGSAERWRAWRTARQIV